MTRFDVPSPDRFVRHITTFVRQEDGTWRRDDERHQNVLLETSRVPALLAAHSVDVALDDTFGGEELPDGLRALIGSKRRPGG